MVIYSIKDLENLCGIKAHTIRMWEKRYGILQAKRTETNIRYYNEEDLRKALNLCILYRSGFKISKLAAMTEQEINEKVALETEVQLAFENSLDALSISMLDLDEYKFENILNHHIDQTGFDETMETVLYPLMDKIGVMWLAESIHSIHETFVMNIISRKLEAEIDRIPIANNDDKPKFLLYQPIGEEEDLSIKYTNYLLKKAGHRVLNLGDNIATEKLIASCKLYKPDYVFTVINSEKYENTLCDYVNEIDAAIDSKLVVAGAQVRKNKLKNSQDCEVLSGLSDVVEFTEKID